MDSSRRIAGCASSGISFIARRAVIWYADKYSDLFELIIDDGFHLAGGLRERGGLRLGGSTDSASLGEMFVILGSTWSVGSTFGSGSSAVVSSKRGGGSSAVVSSKRGDGLSAVVSSRYGGSGALSRSPLKCCRGIASSGFCMR